MLGGDFEGLLETKYKINWNTLGKYFSLIFLKSPWDLENNVVIYFVFMYCLKCEIVTSSNVPNNCLIFDWNFQSGVFVIKDWDFSIINSHFIFRKKCILFHWISFLFRYACFDYFIGFHDWRLGGLKHIFREFFT